MTVGTYRRGLEVSKSEDVPNVRLGAKESDLLNEILGRKERSGKIWSFIWAQVLFGLAVNFFALYDVGVGNIPGLELPGIGAVKDIYMLDFSEVLSVLAVVFTACISLLVAANRELDIYRKKYGGSSGQRSARLKARVHRSLERGPRRSLLRKDPIVSDRELESDLDDLTIRQVGERYSDRKFHSYYIDILLIMYFITQGAAALYVAPVSGYLQNDASWWISHVLKSLIVLALTYVVFSLWRRGSDPWLKADGVPNAISTIDYFVKVRWLGFRSVARGDLSSIVYRDARCGVDWYRKWKTKSIPSALKVITSLCVSLAVLSAVTVALILLQGRDLRIAVAEVGYANFAVSLIALSVVQLMFCLLVVMAGIGLYYFRHHVRDVYLFPPLVAAGFLVVLLMYFSGAAIFGLRAGNNDAVFSIIFTIAPGCVMGMIYFCIVRKRFERKWAEPLSELKTGRVVDEGLDAGARYAERKQDVMDQQNQAIRTTACRLKLTQLGIWSRERAFALHVSWVVALAINLLGPPPETAK